MFTSITWILSIQSIHSSRAIHIKDIENQSLNFQNLDLLISIIFVRRYRLKINN